MASPLFDVSLQMESDRAKSAAHTMTCVVQVLPSPTEGGQAQLGKIVELTPNCLRFLGEPRESLLVLPPCC